MPHNDETQIFNKSVNRQDFTLCRDDLNELTSTERLNVHMQVCEIETKICNYSLTLR